MARLTRRGVALLGVLLTLSLLLVLALAFITQQSLRYQGTVHATQRLLAQSLAETGWRETLVKLRKDADFPPPGDPDQTLFTFSETIRDSAGKKLGSYHVTIDRAPVRDHQLLICEITGEVAESRALYRLKTEWDTARPQRRPFGTGWVVVESGSR